MQNELTYHVYLIRSINHPHKYYKGYTTNIARRLSEHNQGKVKSTAKYKPWQQQTVVSFEKYLKSHSGRAFSSKHF